jgi:hypothetical protein
MQPPEDPSPFLRRVRGVIRVRHLSIRTEDAYAGWIKRFILFHGKRHPAAMGEAEVAAFLTHLDDSPADAEAQTTTAKRFSSTRSRPN